MTELRDWMLIMLFLHREAVPSAPGGSPTFYTAFMGQLENDRNCSQVVHLYKVGTMKGNQPTARTILPMVRRCIAADNPPLIVELPPPAGGAKIAAVLFQCTAIGEVRARQLVGDLPPSARERVSTEIRGQQRNPKRGRAQASRGT